MKILIGVLEPWHGIITKRVLFISLTETQFGELIRLGLVAWLPLQ